ncbi:MAG: alpha/beta hydrolase [Bacteroidetes bacterium]|nr:alpha/beta hydrolase [Bacteroidota bacterium]
MISFKSSGEGKPYWLFLHGFLESSSMWSYLSLSEIPGEKFFVFLPGHGSSPLPKSSDDPSIAAMAEEIEKAFINNVENPIIVVGHSMGGYVGLELLNRNKLSIQKLVLLNSNCWEDSDDKKKDRVRVADIAFKGKAIFINEAIPNLFNEPNLREKKIEVLKKEALELTADGIAYASLAMRTRTDFSDLVKKNADKIVFIHGAKDKLISVESISAVSNQKNLHLIENCGHMAHIEATEYVRSILAKIANFTE